MGHVPEDSENQSLPVGTSDHGANLSLGVREPQ